MNSATLIFPHQLFENHPGLAKGRRVIILEHPRFFTEFSFHKSKILFHLLTMHSYKKFLENDYQVTYLQLAHVDESLSFLQGFKELHLCAVVDHELEKRLKKLPLKLVWYSSPGFFSTEATFKEEFSQEKFHMASFYIQQRKRLDLLLTAHQKPIGGKWSYDTQNRKRLPKNLQVPQVDKLFKKSAHQTLIAAVEKKFQNNPGTLDHFFYPTDFDQARSWFDQFLETRLDNFGPYEDAIAQESLILFHSVLSPLLNVGLLTPEYIVSKALQYAEKNNTSIASLEGFIRQIIGWREFVLGVYVARGQWQRKQNYFEHTQKLHQSFWQATTGLAPVDSSVAKVLNYAYVHHIERLMVLGNMMLLLNTDPDQVYAWFMQFFIDAYDWVMVPNIYGMSQYADGGLMVTKPYISGSNYIAKMSDFAHGPWEPIWDGLYWRFIAQHKQLIWQNPRLKIMTSYLSRMNKQNLAAKISQADNFISSLRSS